MTTRNTYDPRSNVARDAEHYNAAWREHVNQLIHPCLDAGLPMSEWEELRGRLLDIVAMAAVENYGMTEDDAS